MNTRGDDGRSHRHRPDLPASRRVRAHDRGAKTPCRGVVLSYYEFDAKDAPTDAEWKAILDSREPPREPAWLTGE